MTDARYESRFSVFLAQWKIVNIGFIQLIVLILTERNISGIIRDIHLLIGPQAFFNNDPFYFLKIFPLLSFQFLIIMQIMIKKLWTKQTVKCCNLDSSKYSIHNISFISHLFLVSPFIYFYFFYLYCCTYLIFFVFTKNTFLAIESITQTIAIS